MLDWLVSFEPFVYKPVAVLNASPRAHLADDSLREILKTMSAILVEPASSIALLGSGLSEEAMIESPVISRAIINALESLQRYIPEKISP